MPRAAILDRAPAAPSSNGKVVEEAKQPALDFDQQLPDMAKVRLKRLLIPLAGCAATCACTGPGCSISVEACSAFTADVHYTQQGISSSCLQRQACSSLCRLSSIATGGCTGCTAAVSAAAATQDLTTTCC